MKRRRYLAILGALFPLLVACAASPAGSNQPPLVPSAPNVQEPTRLPTPTELPVRLPSAAPTEALLAPTSLPEPTGTASKAPTSVPTALPTAAPSEAPTSVPTSVPTNVPTTVPSAAPSVAPPVASGPGALLFLREGNLWRHNLADGAELQLATAVHAFAASPDGRWLAVVRIVEERADLWLLRPDGTELRRLTDDARAEGSLVWSPAGDQLLYATAAAAPLPHTPDWFTWTAWCRASEVRALALEGGEPLSLGLGCDPAISADGKRIAFATPPQRLDPSMSGASAGIVNSVRLVNRQGGNGWDFTTAPGTGVGGLLVYAPSWSPDSQQLAFQRFVGYQALTDLNYTEVAGSFQGGGELAGVGAGWLFAPRYSSDGRFLLISEHNYSNAAGASGYQAWSLRLLDLAKPDSIALPEGTRGTVASELVRLNQAQQALWLPGEAAAAVLLPVGWSASQAPLAGGAAVPGEVRRWTSEGGVGELLVNEVDFASPLGWLR